MWLTECGAPMESPSTGVPRCPPRFNTDWRTTRRLCCTAWCPSAARVLGPVDSGPKCHLVTVRSLFLTWSRANVSRKALSPHQPRDPVMFMHARPFILLLVIARPPPEERRDGIWNEVGGWAGGSWLILLWTSPLSQRKPHPIISLLRPGFGTALGAAVVGCSGRLYPASPAA